MSALLAQRQKSFPKVIRMVSLTAIHLRGISSNNGLLLMVCRNRILNRTPAKTILGESGTGRIVSVRNSGHGPMYHGYRQPNYMPELKKWNRAAYLMGGFATWWVLWNLYHEPGHIIGEFEYENRLVNHL